uniref:Uncharacterized protein n=1 Tax=Sinocyclocheilus grahami TaxID=75366 RepID=A0A672T0J3_SINGR
RCVCHLRVLQRPDRCATSPKRAWHHLRRPSAPSARQLCRHYSKDADRDTKDTEHPGITVVGTPDPITWIRNKSILFLIELYFGLKFSVEFDSGVKQVGMIWAVDSVRKQCKTLSEAQQRHLAISLDDIIFLLPEDVSVFFDQSSRKFLYITMRLWYLSSADVPEDPESARIFKMDITEDGPQKKIITAVYDEIKVTPCYLVRYIVTVFMCQTTMRKKKSFLFFILHLFLAI